MQSDQKVQPFPMLDINKLTSLSFLEEGGHFSRLEMGTYNDRYVVIHKFWSLDGYPTENPQYPARFETDLKYFASLSSPYLLNPIGITEKDSGKNEKGLDFPKLKMIVHPLIPRGSLNKVKTHLYSWGKKINIAIEAASALEYLHNKNLVHGDIKAANYLLKNDGYQVYLIDLECMKVENEIKQYQDSGTPGYFPPEFIKERKGSKQMDVYCFGIFLIAMILGPEKFKTEYLELEEKYCCFKNKNYDSRYKSKNTKHVLQLIKKTCPSGLYNLITDCLQYNPKNRPSIKQVKDRLQNLRQHLFDIPLSQWIKHYSFVGLGALTGGLLFGPAGAVAGVALTSSASVASSP